MRRTLLLLLTLATMASVRAADVAINETNFPDENFRAFLLGQRYGSDGVLTEEEIAKITDLNLYQKKISNLKGIEHFTALKTLNCQFNKLTSLDVSQNTALIELYCNGNELTALDVSQNKALKTLLCFQNQLTTLDVSQNTKLESLYCSFNEGLTSFDAPATLKYLNCGSCGFTSLDVSKYTALISLSCGNNGLTSLDVSKNTALESLACYMNKLTSLDISKNTALKELEISENQIKGAAMDAIVNNLPTADGEFYPCEPGNSNEGNVCTSAQVAVANGKGWKVLVWDDDAEDFVDYPGSDAVAGITPLASDAQNAPDSYYTLDGKKVGDRPARTGIYVRKGRKVVVK